MTLIPGHPRLVPAASSSRPMTNAESSLRFGPLLTLARQGALQVDSGHADLTSTHVSSHFVHVRNSGLSEPPSGGLIFRRVRGIARTKTIVSTPQPPTFGLCRVGPPPTVLPNKQKFVCSKAELSHGAHNVASLTRASTAPSSLSVLNHAY
jgi:hypothetical protein